MTMQQIQRNQRERKLARAQRQGEKHSGKFGLKVYNQKWPR